jgi:hypothetical protein
VRLLGDNTEKEIGDGRRAEANGGRPFGANHDIRTYSASTPRGPIQRAVADADQGKDHRDFYSDGKDA